MRSRPFAWLDLLLKYSQKLKILLLLKSLKERVEVACIKDTHGSVFLVFIGIPISWKSFFDYASKEGLEDRVVMVAKHFFDAASAGFYQSADDISHYNMTDVDSLMEEAFSEFLTEDERQLIRVARATNIPIKKIIDHVENMQK